MKAEHKQALAELEAVLDKVFVVSAGPGELSTVTALMQVARRDGAKVVFFTATPDTPAAALADHVVFIPAQTHGQRSGRR